MGHIQAHLAARHHHEEHAGDVALDAVRQERAIRHAPGEPPNLCDFWIEQFTKRSQCNFFWQLFSISVLSHCPSSLRYGSFQTSESARLMLVPRILSSAGAVARSYSARAVAIARSYSAHAGAIARSCSAHAGAIARSYSARAGAVARSYSAH